MKKSSVFHLLLAVMLTASSLLFVPDSSSIIAAPEAAIWTAVNIPTEGTAGKWQLAAGSDVKKLAAAGDGTLYAYVTPTGSNNTLYKSTDKGITWSAAGEVSNVIIALVVAPDNIVYYATNSTVYRSLNGGANFSALVPNPGGAGSNNVTITCLAITQLNNSRIVAVGTMDKNAGQFGGVYTTNESELGGNWSDTGLRNCDVLSVAFSPGYSVDRQIIAAGSNESATIIVFQKGSSDWGTDSGNVTISGVVPKNCVAAFPADYANTFFLGVDADNGSGGVFRINRMASPGNSTAVDLNIGAGDNITGFDVSGLAVSGSSGNYFLLAGAANSTRIYASNNSGQIWTRAAKNPTGQSAAIVTMAPDFASSQRIYAGSSGPGSAFSCSVDAGLTWNQLSMIDTGIDALVDFAVSPKYGQDNTLFLLTWSGEHSLWRTQNSGDNWERIYTGTLAGVSSFSHLRVSPQYGTGESVVVLAGAGGEGAIWKSNDKGQTFARRTTGFTIDTLALASNEQYFASSYNGTSNLVYRTTNGGLSYYPPVVAGSQPLSSIKLSPSFSIDKTILAGNSNGWVFLSTDAGASFQTVPGGSSNPPLTGNVFVAFDWQFSSTKIVYAASDNVATSSSRSRVYRYTVGESEQWDNLDNTLEASGILGELCVLPGGTLYAANSHDNGGMERSLNAGAASYQIFEKINLGLANNAALNGLWGSGQQLWSLDTRNLRLMTYLDSLIAPVVPGNPVAGASGVDTRTVTLDWLGLAGAITYEFQVDNDGSFSAIATSLKGETPYTSVRLPNLEPASSYYWRVRVKEPALSPWSPVRYFHTLLGKAGVLPELYSPKTAADGVALRPLFHWGAIGGAARYELLIAADAAFAKPVIDRTGSIALAANAWQCDTNLSYNTTYFWKIRGISDNSSSVWSGVGTFTTLLAPAATSPPLSSYKVTVLSPKTGLTGVSVKPVFEWEPVPGADRYELLVSNNSSFTGADVAKIGNTAVRGTLWQSDVELRHGTTYFWKVRGISGGNYSAWSEAYWFTTSVPAVLAEPQVNTTVELVYPAPGGEGISIKPIFQWKAAGTAERYELEVSTSYQFDNPIIKMDNGNAIPVVVWQSEVALAYGTKYFWHVRAVAAGNVSTWSDTSAFITVGPPPREIIVVELENPAAGAEGVPVMPVFQWKPVAGADRYELLVSTGNTFTDSVIAKTGNDALPVNAWRSDVRLANGTVYYWKIRALNGDGNHTWSKVSAFTTLPPAPPQVKLAVEIPLPCTELDSPANNGSRAATKPLFRWKAVPGADKYELLVSPDMEFTSPVIMRLGNYALPGTSWESEVELKYDTAYWWKVKAVSGNKSAEWSVPGVFTTEPAPLQIIATDTPGLPSWVVYSGAALIAIILLLGASLVTLLMRTKSD